MGRYQKLKINYVRVPKERFLQLLELEDALTVAANRLVGLKFGDLESPYLEKRIYEIWLDMDKAQNPWKYRGKE